MYDSIKYKDGSKIDYLTIFIIYNPDDSLNEEKTLKILAKYLPEFCVKRNDKLPLSIASIKEYMEGCNYQQAVVGKSTTKNYARITFQRDKNNIGGINE